MIAVGFRFIVAAVVLLAATLAPLMLVLTGDPEGAAIAVAVGVPTAVLLLTGATLEHRRWLANRTAMRAWSRREHPANAPALNPPTLRLVATPPARDNGVESPTTKLRKVPA